MQLPSTNAIVFRREWLETTAVVCWVLAMSVGCGRSKFPVADVQGLVSLDGQPVAEAKVVFMPAGVDADGESGPYSQGVTDSEGRFELRTIEDSSRSGAVVGPHTIVVSTRKARLDPNELDRVIVENPESIPMPYTHYKKTPLRYEVPQSGADDVELALTSAGR